MKIITVLATACLLVSPALAETLTYQGVTYNYEVAKTEKATLITGTSDAARPFKLRVARGWVHGTVDGRDVSFSLRDVKRLSTARPAATIASR